MRSDRAEARPAASATVHKSVDWLTDGGRVEVSAGPYSAIQPPRYFISLQCGNPVPALAEVNGRVVLGLDGSRVTV